MERLTTDAPSGNFETMMNFVHGKDGWAHIYDADGKEVNLITWALNHCHDRGCDDFQCKTLEEYDEALSSCMVDFMDCPIAMAYCFASQAVHLRSRLKMYEDTGLKPEEVVTGKELAEIACAMNLLKEYQALDPIDHLRELAQAEKDGRLVVLDEPRKPLVWGDDAHDSILCPNCNHDLMGGFQEDEYCEKDMCQCPYCGQPIDSAKALTREEAEAALKKREGGEN